MHKKLLQLAILTVVITTQAQDTIPKYQSVLFRGVPHVLQKPDFCGEASAEMFLRKLGENMDQDYVFDRSGADPSEGRGIYAAELATALEKIGFNVGDVWNPLEDEEELEEQFAALHRDLVNQIPSIVCMHFSKEDDDEHFRLVLGYDAREDAVIYHESSDPEGSYLRMPRDEFMELWALQGQFQWGVIRMRLDAEDLEYGDASDGLTDADFAQHVLKLREKIPDGFTVVVEKPFVVIGDAHQVEVTGHSTGLVRRAVELLKRDFFVKNPEDIINIWLFKDDVSYRHHTQTIFGHSPDTPYGYYSNRHKALVMNISTGGGTLVHEIVHPFIHANFPECPAWFDEGLASLYEHPTSVNGHIRGLVNWRLPYLKTAIITDRLPAFEWLFSQTEDQFYGEDPGSNYAQSRYLCYYLQERGLLVDYYHAFYENRHDDPTGIDTLMKLLAIDDIVRFQEEWQAWVMNLREDG